MSEEDGLALGLFSPFWCLLYIFCKKMKAESCNFEETQLNLGSQIRKVALPMLSECQDVFSSADLKR